MHYSLYGRYLECQSDTQTLAVIPSIRNTGNKRACSVQVITDNDAWTIMGPFALVPFMECRHRVWSMCHSVRGNVCINGRKYSF